MPFTLNRLSRIPFNEQIVEGIKSAISNGIFSEGDVLPSRERMSRALGVGECTVRSALVKLISDGFLVSRPHIGCTVVSSPVCAVKGDILLVTTERSGSYSWFVFQDTLSSVCATAGYHVSTVFYLDGETGVTGDGLLRASLAEKPSFVVVYSTKPKLPAVSRIIARYGCPYAVIGIAKPRSRLCVGAWYPDFSAALKSFAAHCVKERVFSVCQFDFGDDSIMDASGILEQNGINVERMSLRLLDVFSNLDAIQDMARQMMARRISRGALPDLLFFTDDFITRGAIPVLLENGIRIPRDIRLVTHANCGFQPAFPKSLSRIEIDLAAYDSEFAKNVVGYLSGKPFVRDDSVCCRFVVGETF